MEKDKTKSDRMLKSESARMRRRARKSLIEKRTLSLFAKLRRLRKRKAS